MTHNDRKYWLDIMLKIAEPVISALEKDQLRKRMPVAQKKAAGREAYSHLEAFGRLVNGMAPWLEHQAISPEEETLRAAYAARMRNCLKIATDPSSDDYLNFKDGDQPIVDTAFLAQGLMRAPHELFEKMSNQEQKNILQACRQIRSRKPHFSNWLLFSAVVEAALYRFGAEDWDPMRIDYAVNQFEQWYIGDGHYSDGTHFHADYYNSYVIHPMLLDILQTVGDEEESWKEARNKCRERAKQYALVQERLISPEGTFPVLGRSIAYRFGAFHHLANQVLREELPAELSNAQVRSGLTAVLERTLQAEDMFDNNGWLTIGLTGHQPAMGEGYISTGSLYLCTAVFLPLGLQESHAFWSSPGEDWTSKRAWAGKNVSAYISRD